MQDLDTLTVELTKAAFGGNHLPPKLRYRIQKWLKTLHPQGEQHLQRSEIVKTVTKTLVSALSNYHPVTLAKNEMLASTFADGAIRLDFGSGIPEKVKKAAIAWAKQKGLKPVEASLNKSVQSTSYITFSKGMVKESELTKQVRWSVPV
jgi:hypothetical protein